MILSKIVSGGKKFQGSGFKVQGKRRKWRRRAYKGIKGIRDIRDIGDVKGL